MIDIGANLAHDSFGSDFDEVLSRARDAGVEQIIVTGSSEASSERALELARKHPGFLFSTAGMHPHHASECTPTSIAGFRELAAEPEVRAIGETGLDFFRDISPRNLQEKAFEAHIELAIETEMPMFLHERDAYPRFSEIISAYRGQLTDVLVHCFTGSKDALYSYLDLDCHIGITGWICDERRGTHLLSLVNNIPDDRLMIETDAPYLLPRSIDKKPKKHRNEPCYLPYVRDTIAEACNKSADQVAHQTSANARRFFRLP
jgi:TatD DNase family protein